MFPNECCADESGCCCGLAEPRPVAVVCEACGGEGRVIRGQYEDERDCGPCPHCDRGMAYVPAEPITAADLQRIDEEMMELYKREDGVMAMTWDQFEQMLIDNGWTPEAAKAEREAQEHGDLGDCDGDLEP